MLQWTQWFRVASRFSFYFHRAAGCWCSQLCVTDYFYLSIEAVRTQQHHEEEDDIQMPIPAVEVKKEKSEKSLAFKALKIQEESANDDEESALLSTSIKKFMKFNKRGTGNIYGATSNPKGKEKETVLDVSSVTQRSTWKPTVRCWLRKLRKEMSWRNRKKRIRECLQHGVKVTQKCYLLMRKIVDS